MAPKRVRSDDDAEVNPSARSSVWQRGVDAAVAVALIILVLGQYTTCLRCATLNRPYAVVCTAWLGVAYGSVAFVSVICNVSWPRWLFLALQGFTAPGR